MTPDAAPHGARRTLTTGVEQLALRSATLPPFTTTWLTLIGSSGRGLLIDPGFSAASDLSRVVRWLRECGAHDVDRVLLSHTHRDHVAGLEALLSVLGDLPVHLHPAERDRLPPGIHSVPLGDGRLLVVGDTTVRAHHTPGHAPGHLVFEVDPGGTPGASGERPGLVTGDLVTEHGAPWIGLPDGDVDSYLDSVRKARALRPAWLATAHGGLVADPDDALAAAADHRRRRREATYASLAEPMRLSEITHAVYGSTPDAMLPYLRAATLANLLSLMRALRVVHLGEDEDGPYARAPGGS